MNRPLFLSIGAAAALLPALCQAGPAPMDSKMPAPMPPPPITDLSGPFFGVQGGALWIDDVSWGDWAADFDVGWGVTAPAGYRFANGISIGGSAGYYTADVDTVTICGYDVSRIGSADVETVPLMFNLGYTIPLGGPVSLNLGGGIGAAYNRVNIDVHAFGLDLHSHADDWNLAWQGSAQLAIAVCPNGELNLGYRYLGTETDLDTFHGHIAEGGFTFRW